MSDTLHCPDCREEFRWLDRNAVPHDEHTRTSFNAYWRLTWHVEGRHPELLFLCPRSMEGGGRFGGEAFWKANDTCSYCGSLHPNRFFEAVEAGAEVGPTDKNYKVYLDLPNPDVGKPTIYSSTNSEECPGEGWLANTPEVRDQFDWSGGEGSKWVKPTLAHSTIHAKFYFQHLSAEQRARFIDLVNSKRMKLGYPGYFYSLPYFCRSASAQDAA